MTSKANTRLALVLVALTAGLVALTSGIAWLPQGMAAEAVEAGGLDPGVVRWGFIAAAVATGLSSLGAAYAVAAVGSAGVGALAEKPELLGRILVLVGLAEGIAIYGLIISILILNQIT